MCRAPKIGTLDQLTLIRGKGVQCTVDVLLPFRERGEQFRRGHGRWRQRPFDSPLPASPGPEPIDGAVPCYPQEPARGKAEGTIVCVRVRPRLDEHFLQDFLCLTLVIEDPDDNPE